MRRSEIDAIPPEGDVSFRQRAVEPDRAALLVVETSSSLFNSTNFEYDLRNLGVEYLAVMGILTDQCVETAGSRRLRPWLSHDPGR